VEYLVTETGQNDASAAAELAEELGRLPLALAHAGAYIANTPALTIRDYLGRFRSIGLQIQNDPDLLGSEIATVCTTWEITLQRLIETSPQSIDLLTFCAHLAPEDLECE